jgi:hypothetical protein
MVPPQLVIGATVCRADVDALMLQCVGIHRERGSSPDFARDPVCAADTFTGRWTSGELQVFSLPAVYAFRLSILYSEPEDTVRTYAQSGTQTARADRQR